MDLEGIADDLYGLPASEFTAARDARAAELRRAKQRDLAAAVKGLRRPSAAAEALNRLARAHPAAISQLVALGDQLRAAQARLSGDDIRALGRQRREVISSVGRLIADLARDDGRALGATAEREVLTSLDTALAEPAAAAALVAGRLTEALQRSDLGPTGVGDPASDRLDVVEPPLAAAAVTVPKGPASHDQVAEESPGET